MELVRTGPGDRIDHATGCAAEFGGEASRFNFNRLIQFERHRYRTKAFAEFGDVQAIDVVGIFSYRRSADVWQVAKCGVAKSGLRRKVNHRSQVASDGNAGRELTNFDYRSGCGPIEIRNLNARTGDHDAVFATSSESEIICSLSLAQNNASFRILIEA